MSGAESSKTYRDGEVAPPYSSTSGSSNFLFVNETLNAATYKQGNRHDVRSHLRKLAAKQFRKTHKTTRERATTLPKYAPLTTQNLDSEFSKNLEHHRDCPSTTSSSPGRGLSTTSSDSLSEVPKMIGITELPIGTTLDSTLPETPEPVKFRGDYKKCCSVCGSLLNNPKLKQRYLSKDESLVRRSSKWKPFVKPNVIKSLGAGRIDPFSSLPMDGLSRDSQELMDHAVTYLLPGLIPDDVPPGEVRPLAKAWFTSGLRTPLLFHALVFSGSNHLDFVRSSNVFPNAVAPLSHKLIVIQKLKEALSDPSQASRDEIILAILILASQEVFISEKRSSPFNSPLKSLQWLDVYGNFKFVPEHMKAVGDIVTMRGGLETIELYGLADIIAGGDVLSATNSITKPGFPPLKSFETCIAALRVWATSPPRPTQQTLAAAFWKLEEYGITDFMLQVFDSIAAYTLALEYQLQGKPYRFSLGAMARTRTAIQHRLMVLPTQDELNVTPSSRINIYECCRLTAMIFAVAVPYPVPNPYNLLQDLVQRLKIAIETLDIETCGPDLFEVLLWILALGGIAALDKPERPWFVSQFAFIVRRLKIDDWGSIEDILETFLWLESACSQGGRQLWDEAIAVPYIVSLRLCTL